MTEEVNAVKREAEKLAAAQQNMKDPQLRGEVHGGGYGVG